MIISHQHRLIFVKTRKTAGTSIELGLRRLCGPNDVITPVGEDEKLARSLGLPRPQHTYIPVPRMDARALAMLLRRGRRPSFYNHMPARRIRAIAGRRTWDDYLTVAVERNPWERALSLFHWLMHWQGNAAITELTTFLRHATRQRPMALSNWWLYTVRNTVVVDRVLRYEDLDLELKRLWRQLGHEPPELPRAKASHGNDRRHHREVMSSADRDLVAAACSREIDHFGYEF
jgi:Sulfotransferase family